MVHNAVLAINAFGVLVSLFSIFVTLNIFSKYKLRSSGFFIATSIAIFFWNIIHLIFNFIDEDTLGYNTIRFLWLILVYSGLVFVYTLIYGYSTLRYEHLNYRLIIYASMITIFAMLFALKPDWVDVGYDPIDGWVTVVNYQLFWSLFSLTILLMHFIEVIVPLINTYAYATVNRNPLLIMLLAIILAIFSNALEPILSESGLPQALRFLIADIGFLLFFVILLRYPFTGLYDNTEIKQVIVANREGLPLSTFSTDRSKSILASGAIIGINSILEEITATKELDQNLGIEATRKIELGAHQFFIIIKGQYIVIFQFERPTGVCYSKFISLSNILVSEPNGDTTIEAKLNLFELRLLEYFQGTKIIDDLELS